MPGKDIVLQTQDADYYLFKTDILAGLVTYSTDKNIAANLQTITAAQARDIIEMNRRGEKPLTLSEEGDQEPVESPHNVDLAGGDISRFDKAKKKKKKNKQRRQGDREPGRQEAQNNNHAE
jgi:hypothetical protein